MKTISYIMICLSLAISQEAQELSFSDDNMGRLRLIEMERELNPIEEVALLNLVIDAFSFLKEKTSQTDIGTGDDIGTPEQKLWTILYPHCGEGISKILTSELATFALNELKSYLNETADPEDKADNEEEASKAAKRAARKRRLNHD